MKHIILIMVMLFGYHAWSQSIPESCGAKPTEEAYQNATHAVQTRADILPRDISVPKTVKLKPHIIRNSKGTGGLSIIAYQRAIQQLANDFAKTNITFDPCAINYIDNDKFFEEIVYSSNSINQGIEYDMALPNIEEDALNIFFVPNAVFSSGSQFQLNWSSFSSYKKLYNKNWVIMSNAYADDTNSFGDHKKTLAHEVGHYFDLFHTHRGGNEGGIDERVTRLPILGCQPNCQLAGDLVCDTPADPNLDSVNDDWPAEAELVDKNCNYIGTGSDACRIRYTPNTTNIMSYAYLCRADFTEDQVERMHTSIVLDRPELASECTTGPCIENITITTVIPSGSIVNYETSNSIIGRANNRISNQASATYNAGNEVTLLPNFTAEYGSSFDAIIDGCNQTIRNTDAILNTQVRSSKTVLQSETLSLQLYPNPLKEQGTVLYTLQEKSNVSIQIRDLKGMTVQSILNQVNQQKGVQEIEINRNNLQSGVYLIDININGKQHIKRLLIK